VEVTVLPTAEAVAAAAADGFVSAAHDAVASRGRFTVALSGGRTPDGAFALLRESPRVDQVPWQATDVFWTDERAVDPDAPLSNARRAQEVLLDHVAGLRPEAVHRMRAEGRDLDAAAQEYEDMLRETLPRGASGVPELDLVWLGMGTDGHTASLCPNDPSLAVTDRWVVPTWPAGYETARLTLTYPVLDAARQVTFLVTGEDKAATLAAVQGGADLPAARVRARSVTWLVDAQAAGLLIGERT
jgi:6-phosphogluconolactonase